MTSRPAAFMRTKRPMLTSHSGMSTASMSARSLTATAAALSLVPPALLGGAWCQLLAGAGASALCRWRCRSAGAAGGPSVSQGSLHSSSSASAASLAALPSRPPTAAPLLSAVGMAAGLAGGGAAAAAGATAPGPWSLGRAGDPSAAAGTPAGPLAAGAAGAAVACPGAAAAGSACCSALGAALLLLVAARPSLSAPLRRLARARACSRPGKAPSSNRKDSHSHMDSTCGRARTPCSAGARVSVWRVAACCTLSGRPALWARPTRQAGRETAARLTRRPGTGGAGVPSGGRGRAAGTL